MHNVWKQRMMIGLVLLGIASGALPGAAQDKQTLIPNISPLYPEVLRAIEDLEAGEQIQVFLATEREAYGLGEPFEARFAVSADSYVALMRIATNGTLTFLTPNRRHPDGKVQGNVVYSTGALTPDGRAGYALGLQLFADPPTGSEVLNLFCSPTPFPAFDGVAADADLYRVRPDDEAGLRAVLAWVEQLRRTEWSGTSVAFLVEPDIGRAAVDLEEKPVPAESSLLEKSALIPDAAMQKTLPRKFGALRPMGGTGTTGKMFPLPGAQATEDLFAPGP